MRFYISVPLINLFWVLGSLFGLVFNPVMDTVHRCIAKLVNYLIFIKNPRIVTDVIEAYRVEGCLVGVKAFKVVLNLCRKANLADEGLWVLRKMKEMNCPPDTPAYHVVMGLFCEKGDMDVAAELTREMGLGSGNNNFPHVVAYSVLLEGFCRFGSLERALELLREMEKEALHILDRMEASGCSPNRVTMRTLIEGLCTEGHTEDAYKLIDKVIAGCSVSDGECYSSLVLSLLRIKRLEEAEKLFRWMVASAVKPDGLASSTMIKRLCLEVRVLDGFCLYCELEELAFLSSIDLDIYSILLSGLCKESCMVEAAKLARLMVVRRIPMKALGTALIILNMSIRSGSDGFMVMLQARGRWSVTGFSIEQTSLRLMLIALAVLHKEHEQTGTNQNNSVPSSCSVDGN
ncbi:tetratricopeptide repeat (TPR)-like superfamily protein [Actinidia rufa]|uniref:Tetratricopeptide repeat (TPR)-like superfamily protein n=1 Tax=Actinidia rufa TaxID=165716 RepID=A0A7J0FQZ1_9ERIC|nr:tetratricopeptide repeat (TPR)-like superfamily protein [Actinidia rufa]